MKLRYSKEQIEPGKWKVTGYKWQDCYCDKETFSLVLEQEKRPVKSDFVHLL